MDYLNQNLGRLNLGRDSSGTPIYVIGKTSNEVCFFQPMSEQSSTISIPDLPFAIKTGEIYRLKDGQITEYSDLEILKMRDRSGCDRGDYTELILPSMLLGCRMRDYEQNSAEVTSLNAASELTLVTSMREPYLTKLDLKTELGESFEVTVLGKSGARGCSVFCKPTTILPESVTVGSRLEIFLKSDRVPVATKMLVRAIETGYADINWDVIDMLYGEKGARVHSAPNLALVPANPATKSLNSGQREVLAHYLSDKHNDARIVAVESPPGSGKTSVAVAMVRSFRAEGTQVVISAANEPMYNFLEKLSEIGVRDKRVVHLIAPSREVTRPSPYSLLADQSGDHHDRFVELREDYTGAARKDKRRIKKELFRIHNETLKSTALSPNVVVGTVDAILAKVMASGSDAIQQALRNVTRIIIDESSQLTEAAFNAIILRFAKAKIFLIGDSKQLPPFRYEKGELISELAARSSLDVVRACMNFPVIKFRFVYRAAACLIGPASEIFYGGRLVSMKPLSAVNPVRCYTSDNETRCVLIKVEGKAKRSGKSKRNQLELHALVKVVGQIERDGCKKEDVMIISYYKAQGEAVARALPGYEVHTVDSAQGREKAVVIVLTTRDAVPINGGFLLCPNRCNVAITRAKEALIVLAHPSLLTGTHPISAVLATKYFKHIDQI